MNNFGTSLTPIQAIELGKDILLASKSEKGMKTLYAKHKDDRYFGFKMYQAIETLRDHKEYADKKGQAILDALSIFQSQIGSSFLPEAHNAINFFKGEHGFDYYEPDAVIDDIRTSLPDSRAFVRTINMIAAYRIKQGAITSGESTAGDRGDALTAKEKAAYEDEVNCHHQKGPKG